MKKGLYFGFILVLLSLFTRLAMAHYGMIIPSDTMIMQDEKRTLHLTLSFSHPFELIGMALSKPNVFKVVANGEKQDLTSGLKPAQVMTQPAWEADYKIKRPGVYKFYMAPQPYWEPAEDCYIIHYTQTVVTAFGDDEGWDSPIGLKTEIVPLSKPFGLYTGNVFQGIVKLDGNIVPFAEVEIEYYNENGTAKAPTEYFITQTIKADSNGVFTYAVPRAGWWGFAALNTADEKMKHEGEDKDVELGAVIWVKFHDWKTK
ncbi:MAG: DUF4198 domain-containing protein [Deltaproteobacteria bacterium]|nr:DUF4198 domain-containing protein [Deltaproteobacteria bacterium]